MFILLPVSTNEKKNLNVTCRTKASREESLDMATDMRLMKLAMSTAELVSTSEVMVSERDR